MQVKLPANSAVNNGNNRGPNSGGATSAVANSGVEYKCIMDVFTLSPWTALV
mgnify:CR=1 FL=1